ncbi:MAG TPA: dTDP-4-dehydrorhamnose 3,5-epimerase family protein [Dehalococcoidia bacterium]|nr:dTDP-4-dehydrorhamnose 3,5-epimerase family protein [Dehalococcoidia bacterium]
MIQGVEIKRLTRHADERGFLMELLRGDDPIFTKFGQCYVSMNYPGVVRAWHYHKVQDDYFVVVKGMVKVGLYDMREASPTRGEVAELYLGDDNNIVVKIPAGVAHGYKTVGVEPSLLVNFPTELYNREEPDEHRLPWDTDQIPFNWDITFK